MPEAWHQWGPPVAYQSPSWKGLRRPASRPAPRAIIGGNLSRQPLGWVHHLGSLLTHGKSHERGVTVRRLRTGRQAVKSGIRFSRGCTLSPKHSGLDLFEAGYYCCCWYRRGSNVAKCRCWRPSQIQPSLPDRRRTSGGPGHLVVNAIIGLAAVEIFRQIAWAHARDRQSSTGGTVISAKKFWLGLEAA